MYCAFFNLPDFTSNLMLYFIEFISQLLKYV